MQPSSFILHNSSLFFGSPRSGKTRRLIRAYRTHAPSRILCLSFFDANAAFIKDTLEAETGDSLPWITTMQRFIFSLLHEHAATAGLPGDAVAISAVARSLVIRQAWSEVKGDLWRQYRDTPGATDDLTRIVNWLSANRTGWTVEEGELSDHELGRVYRRYIELCAAHRLLTFQEASLRALELLARQDIAARLHTRFPVVLIDDLHHARPDQLRLIERLIGPETVFIGTAWLNDAHHDPRLRYIRDAIRNWGATEILDHPDEACSPVIHHIASRLDTPSDAPPPDSGDAPPVELITATTAEDEAQAMAMAVAHTLESDPALKPEDILIVCADTGLTRFMQRTLAGVGVLTPSPNPSLRQNPLIRAGLLVARWYARGPSPDIVRALLRLPVFDLDPLDLQAVEHAAIEQNTLLLNLKPSDTITLRNHETWAILNKIKYCLTRLNRKQPASALITEALTHIDALKWTETSRLSSPEQHTAWLTAYEAWIEQIRALEQTVEALGLRTRETATLIERTLDHVAMPEAGEGVRFAGPDEVEGVRARLACVCGLSETAIPRMDLPFQLMDEDNLPRLFADGRHAVCPALRNHAAWIERESRRLAAMLSRGDERLILSVGRHAPGGGAQLPSPFFERLLGDEGEIDRNGEMMLHASPLWRHTRAPRAALTRKEHAPTTERADRYAASRVLRAPIFSASQIRTYLRCPLQFFYDRVLHLDSDETPGAFRRGSLLHEVLCATLGDGRLQAVDLRDRSRPEWLDDSGMLTRRALDILNAAWTGQSFDLPDGGRYAPDSDWERHFGPKLQRDAVKLWAERVLRQWATFEVEGRGDGATRRPILLEMPFRIEIDDFLMIGRIDRIDEVEVDGVQIYDVLDYKTGSGGAASLTAQINKFLPERGAAPTDYQLPIYALALQSGVEGIRATPRMLTYINLEKLDRTTRGGFKAEAARVIQLIEDGPLDDKKGGVPVELLSSDILDGIRRTLLSMASSPYHATPGFHCSMCGFRSACSRGQGYAGNE